MNHTVKRRIDDTRPAVEALPLRFILIAGLLVTGIALVESWRGWWYAPFPIAHALLALCLPLGIRGIISKRPGEALRSRPRLLVAPIALGLLFVAGFVLLYSFVLFETQKTTDPNWNLIATYDMLGALYVARYGRLVVVVAGYLLLGVWPMFGEEFFYRAFLLKGLSLHMSQLAAAGISSTLFGLRHAFQLAYLWPAYPFAAGIAYFIWACGLGLLWSWAYFRTQSIWQCCAVHSLNLILAPFVLALLYR